MTNPSIKNASTADMETAIAQAIAQLTGWENCSASIQSAQYAQMPGAGETAELHIKLTMRAAKDDSLPI